MELKDLLDRHNVDPLYVNIRRRWEKMSVLRAGLSDAISLDDRVGKGRNI